jgi:hypothetical protein
MSRRSLQAEAENTLSLCTSLRVLVDVDVGFPFTIAKLVEITG